MQGTQTDTRRSQAARFGQTIHWCGAPQVNEQTHSETRMQFFGGAVGSVDNIWPAEDGMEPWTLNLGYNVRVCPSQTWSASHLDPAHHCSSQTAFVLMRSMSGSMEVTLKALS